MPVDGVPFCMRGVWHVPVRSVYPVRLARFVLAKVPLTGTFVVECAADMKNDMERGVIGAWARKERLALGLSVEQVVARLASMGAAPDPAYIRSIESGSKRPRPDSEIVNALALVYGSRPVAPETAPQADLGALLVSQQALIDRLTTQNDLLRQLLELHLPKPGAADPTDIVGADKARQHPLPLAPDEPLPAPEDAAQDR
jgi:transcriptional regulator with XRE-family HTH domain